MTQNNGGVVARQDNLVVQDVAEEVMVYDLKRHKAHCLNKTAAFVWRHCDGTADVKQLAKLLEQEVQSPVDETLILYTLDKLGKANLLEESSKQMLPDFGISRRRMVSRLGLGALFALPVVTSVVAPTAAQTLSRVVAVLTVAPGTCTAGVGPAACFSTACCTGGGQDRHLCTTHIGGPPACDGTPCVDAAAASPCNQ